MKTDNSQQEREIDELLKDIRLEKYSISFTENLLFKIEKETIKEKKKKSLLLSLQIAAGVIAILSVPVLTYYLGAIRLPDFSFSITLPKIHFDPLLLSTGSAVLFLLIMDTLIRKHINNKKNF
jgi:hypothetical protein